MKFEFDIKGTADLIKTLESLPVEVVSKRGGPVKLALKKAAMVIRDEESRRFNSLVNANGTNETTGLLNKSIIVKRGRMEPGTKGEKYIVTFKRSVYVKSLISAARKLGTAQSSETVTTRKTAQLFEWGSSHQPPRKFILPSFHAKAGEAMDVFKDDLKRRIDIIAKRIARRSK